MSCINVREAFVTSMFLVSVLAPPSEAVRDSSLSVSEAPLTPTSSNITDTQIKSALSAPLIKAYMFGYGHSFKIPRRASSSQWTSVDVQNRMIILTTHKKACLGLSNTFLLLSSLSSVLCLIGSTQQVQTQTQSRARQAVTEVSAHSERLQPETVYLPEAAVSTWARLALWWVTENRRKTGEKVKGSVWPLFTATNLFTRQTKKEKRGREERKDERKPLEEIWDQKMTMQKTIVHQWSCL